LLVLRHFAVFYVRLLNYRAPSQKRFLTLRLIHENDTRHCVLLLRIHTLHPFE
jgi:hypothetical protein